MKAIARKGPRVGFGDLVDGTDVGVMQRGGGLRFPIEAFARFFVLEQMGGEKLQRHDALFLHFHSKMFLTKGER